MSEQLPISDRSGEGQGLPGKSEKLRATIDGLNTRKDQLEAVLAEERRKRDAAFEQEFQEEYAQLDRLNEALQQAEQERNEARFEEHLAKTEWSAQGVKFPAIPTEVRSDGTPIYGKFSEGFRGVLSERTAENEKIVEQFAVMEFGGEFGISAARCQEAVEHIRAFIKQEDRATYTDFDEPGLMNKEAWGGRDYPFLEVGVNRMVGRYSNDRLPQSRAVVAGVVFRQTEHESMNIPNRPQHIVHTVVPFEFGRSASAEDLRQVARLLSEACSSVIKDHDPRQVAEKLDPRMVALLAQAAERARPGDDEAVEQVDHDSFHDYLLVQHVPNKKDIHGNRWTGLYRLDLETYLRSVIRKEFEPALDERKVDAYRLRTSFLDAVLYRDFRTGFEEWRATQNTQRLGQTAVEG